MARPDMRKTIAETFERKPTQEEIEALMKKPRSKLTDEERELVEDHHLDSSDPYPQFEPIPRRPDDGPMEQIPNKLRARAEPADVAKSAAEKAASKASRKSASETPAAAMERAAEERRLAEIEAAKMRPNKPTPEDFQALRDIDAEIERLQEKRKGIPGGMQVPDDMERGSDMSYEDMLLRK